MSLFGICFLTGLAILLFNLIFGSLSDFFSIDLDLDLDSDGGFGHGLLGFLSPSTLSGFLIAFGGIGFYLEKLSVHPVMMWLVAIISGTVAGFSLWKLMRFLKQHENGAAPEKEDLIGLPAEVVGAIPADGFGSIRYAYNGNRYSAPAVSYDGTRIPQGSRVAIISIKQHVFYVSEINLEE